MIVRPGKNYSVITNDASRLRFRINEAINRQVGKIDTTEGILARSRQGKFNFGAYQLNGLSSRSPDGAIVGVSFGGPATVGP
tara:strand:- start:160 stop:405 length:246 start_codon:yes stop_codon:yes gene_type:complete